MFAAFLVEGGWFSFDCGGLSCVLLFYIFSKVTYLFVFKQIEWTPRRKYRVYSRKWNCFFKRYYNHRLNIFVLTFRFHALQLVGFCFVSCVWYNNIIKFSRTFLQWHWQLLLFFLQRQTDTHTESNSRNDHNTPLWIQLNVERQ